MQYFILTDEMNRIIAKCNKLEIIYNEDQTVKDYLYNDNTLISSKLAKHHYEITLDQYNSIPFNRDTKQKTYDPNNETIIDTPDYDFSDDETAKVIQEMDTKIKEQDELINELIIASL